MSEQEIENEIIAKNLNATELTPQLIDDSIKYEQFHTFPGNKCMVCLLTLTNGFQVHGVSYCFNPEKFDEELGKKYSRENARDKIWELEGYLLRQIIHQKLHEKG